MILLYVSNYVDRSCALVMQLWFEFVAIRCSFIRDASRSNPVTEAAGRDRQNDHSTPTHILAESARQRTILRIEPQNPSVSALQMYCITISFIRRAVVCQVSCAIRPGEGQLICRKIRVRNPGISLHQIVPLALVWRTTWARASPCYWPSALV